MRPNPFLIIISFSALTLYSHGAPQEDAEVQGEPTAQTTPLAPPAHTTAQHHEVPDDPPAPVEVRRSRRVGPPSIVSRGAFTSVQVNIDEMGNNLIGDAANEPTIAIDPTDPNKMAIGWRQSSSPSREAIPSGKGSPASVSPRFRATSSGRSVSSP